MTALEPFRNTDRGRALLAAIVVAAGAAYAASAPRCVLGGDNGEFATLFATGGIAHPPGYPAMILWLRGLRWLPAATPAQGAAFATALAGVIAVFLLQRACLAWGARAGTTALVSAVYAFSPLAWKMSCHAEVFAMNAAIAAGILWLSAPSPPLSALPRAAALGLCAGLGLANHHTIVLLAPIGLFGAIVAIRESARPVRAAALGIGAFAAGVVLPYAYLYWVARTADPTRAFLWIERRDIAGLWFHFRRGGYGTFALGSKAVARQPAANLALFARAVACDLLGLPLALVAGAIACGKGIQAGRTEAPVSRKKMAAFLLLGATFVLSGPLFVATFNVPLTGAGPRVVERFYLLPELVMALLAAVALDWVVARFRRPLPPGAVAALVVLAGGSAAAYAYPQIREYNRPTVENYIRNSLRSAPPNAIVVAGGDHRLFGFLYVQKALGLRQDVRVVNPGPLPQRWYREEMKAQTGVDFETPRGGPIGPITMANRLVATGRPLFYADWIDPKLSQVRHDSIGTLMHVLTDSDRGFGTEALEGANEALFRDFFLETSVPKDSHGWGALLMTDYARPWLELANAYGAQHRMDRAEACVARAREFTPEIVRTPAPQ